MSLESITKQIREEISKLNQVLHLLEGPSEEDDAGQGTTTQTINRRQLARRLAVRMYWMRRKGWECEQLKKFGSHAGQPGHRDGVR
jgi:hypothetical protein